MAPKKKRDFALKSEFYNCDIDANFAVKVMEAILEEGHARNEIHLRENVQNGSFPFAVLKRLKTLPDKRGWKRVLNTIAKFNLLQDVKQFHLPTVDELQSRLLVKSKSSN